VVRQWKSETSNNALGDGIFTMITMMAARDTLAVEKEVVFAGLRSGRQTKNVFLISGGSDGVSYVMKMFACRFPSRQACTESCMCLLQILVGADGSSRRMADTVGVARPGQMPKVRGAPDMEQQI
jgi:hypothetical protein